MGETGKALPYATPAGRLNLYIQISLYTQNRWDHCCTHVFYVFMALQLCCSCVVIFFTEDSES